MIPVPSRCGASLTSMDILHEPAPAPGAHRTRNFMDYCVRVASKDFHAIKAESQKLPEDVTSEFDADVEAQYRVGDYAWFVLVDKKTRLISRRSGKAWPWPSPETWSASDQLVLTAQTSSARNAQNPSRSSTTSRPLILRVFGAVRMEPAEGRRGCAPCPDCTARWCARPSEDFAQSSSRDRRDMSSLLAAARQRPAADSWRYACAGSGTSPRSPACPWR